jgi:hypothetical protein
VDDGFGENGIDLVQFYKIDGNTIGKGFDWQPFLSAVGSHTITYYVVNNADKWVMADREFFIASAPQIELVYGDRYETLTVNINGNAVPATHVVIIIGSKFNPLDYVKAFDRQDPSVDNSFVKTDGGVDPDVLGVYSITYVAENRQGVKSLKRTMYFNVRHYKAYELSLGLDAYKEIQRKMSETDFTSYTKASGSAAGQSMVIYSTRQRKGDETFFENLSNGGKPWGVNADFARRVYRNGDSYRFSSAEGGFSSSGGVVTGANWSEGKDWTEEEFKNKFGRGINDITNYVITPSSVSNPENGIGYNDKDGSYFISYQLKINKGNQSEGVIGYAKQIPTMSGGKECTNFFKCTIDIRFDENFRLIDVKIFESYEVNSHTIAGKVDMQANLTDYYEYPDTVTVTKF